MRRMLLLLYLFSMNMKIATHFEVVKFRVTHS